MSRWVFTLLLISVLINSAFAANETSEIPQNKILTQSDIGEAYSANQDSYIYHHKPLYFAYGEPLTKVQLSFKSPLVEDIPFYFGYTQIIFWELKTDSKPFLDATYNPEFFYRFKVSGSPLKFVDFGLWEHNSNGKSGDASRSFDQTYARLTYRFLAKDIITQVSGKFSFIYNDDPTNTDIADYISPFEFEVRFIQLFNWWVDKSELNIKIHPGGKWANKSGLGGTEVGYNFRLGGLKLVPAFYVQYYDGYAETLLNYNQKVNQWRFGILF